MKPKKRGNDDLLKLLGGDTSDPVPSSFAEAKMIQ
jgi:hypothetical protein